METIRVSAEDHYLHALLSEYPRRRESDALSPAAHHGSPAFCSIVHDARHPLVSLAPPEAVGRGGCLCCRIHGFRQDSVRPGHITGLDERPKTVRGGVGRIYCFVTN